MEMQQIGKNAKAASHILATASTNTKNDALCAIADALVQNSAKIIAANNIDIENGKKNGLNSGLIDRLTLDEKRINGIADAAKQVAALSDPIGEIKEGCIRPNGLNIKAVAVPVGVIGIIYEARPNVTVDAAALCLKSGNAVILRGGKEAINSNKQLTKIMQNALLSVGLPENCIQLVTDTSRQSATELMQLSGYVDLLIPRGGAGLIKSVVENAKVPSIHTGTGNCHIYVDETANLEMAANIVDNAKTSRVSVCNACESLLVDEKVAADFLPLIKKRLDKSNVEIRGCKITKAILGDDVVLATEDDYATEFLDYIISVRVVSGIDQAIEHIMKYTTGHSECIVTNSYANAEKFTSSVDAAAVYVNASTRFTDGGEFGFGAEIGISTQKIHARGPMGLRQLTSIKYVVTGNGQIR